MCNGDLMANATVAEWGVTCQEIDEITILGGLECNSTDMEIARSHCCANDCNLNCLSTKNKNKKIRKLVLLVT